MGIRTPGLVIANDALYQLSYTPRIATKTIEVRRNSASEIGSFEAAARPRKQTARNANGIAGGHVRKSYN
jgi:hypothetical protein